MNKPFIRHSSATLCLLALCALTGCATRTPSLRLEGLPQEDVRNFSGIEYVSLTRLCDLYNLDWSWDNFSKVAILKSKDKRILLREGSPVLTVNGSQVLSNPAPALHEGACYVPVSFALSILGPLPGTGTLGALPPAPKEERFAVNTIVIDPGHGGEDAGARSRRFSLREKDVTLGIAKRLKRLLEEHAIKVVLTRDSDRFLPLSKRAAMANESKADLFVSIHANAARAKRAKGFECYYLSEAVDDNARAQEASENASLAFEGSSFAKRSRALEATVWDMILTENRIESQDLAGYICDSVGRNLSIRNRGVKSAQFHVLKGAHMPSVLIEVGFLTNSLEALKLKEFRYLDKVSRALAEGILAYKSAFERTNGFTQ